MTPDQYVEAVFERYAVSRGPTSPAEQLGSTVAGPLPRIVVGILTYQSSWTPPFGVPFRDALAELSADQQLDVGCTLIHGAFEAGYTAGGEVELRLAEGPRSLVQFLMRFLKQLQALATIPAIDYEAYLARFRRDDGTAP